MPALTAVSRSTVVWNFATWRLNDGTLLDTELTDEEYAALGLRGAGEPPRRGVPSDAVWVKAVGGSRTYPTADKKLPFGGYDRIDPNKVRIGLDDRRIVYHLDGGRIEDLTEADRDLVIEGRTYRIRDGAITRLP